MDYDHKEIEKLYVLDVLPISLRHLYQRAIKEEYRDISEMREEIEQVLAEMTEIGSADCKKPCKWILELRQQLAEVGQLFKFGE